MGTAELKLQLHQIIDAEPDIKKLEAIYTLLKSSPIAFEKMSLEEYTDAIDTARAQIAAGNFKTVEQVEKESNNW
ncbi:MAG: hypothetical protein KDC79_09235 [Cyclobacteriaceae bacterium]|nr:hypothetical protein [Cyclobacteriaceae bacterium]